MKGIKLLKIYKDNKGADEDIYISYHGLICIEEVLQLKKNCIMSMEDFIKNKKERNISKIWSF